MTVSGEPTSEQPPEAVPSRRPARHRDSTAVHEVCPFLAADDRAWRSAYAAREHRCHAVQPPAPLAIAKQRQLCLLQAHATCATFVAASELAAGAVPATPGDEGASLWAATASTPLVLEPARRMGALPGASAKGSGQALLVGLMVLAFLVLVIARTQSPAASGSATPVPVAGAGVVAASESPAGPTFASVAPTAPPSPSPSTIPSQSPSATPAPSVKATPRPTTAATRRYRVKAGDTLSSIAARYGTTVRVLARLNDISDPRIIRIGQVLQIP